MPMSSSYKESSLQYIETLHELYRSLLAFKSSEYGGAVIAAPENVVALVKAEDNLCQLALFALAEGAPVKILTSTDNWMIISANLREVAQLLTQPEK